MKHLLYLILGGILITTPLMAYENLCPNARPGCGGNCHGDDRVQQCPTPEPNESLKLFFGLQGLSLNH